jgi:uncharacterized protein (DUF433 family)
MQSVGSEIAHVKYCTEEVGGEPYTYRPMGSYVVSAAGVCGGAPTFKYTRVGIQHALELLAAGRGIEDVAAIYHQPVAAIREAIGVAALYVRDSG